MPKAKPSHQEFLEELQTLLAQFGHIGTGSAAQTGISSNKIVHKQLPKRSVDDYEYDISDKDWFEARKIAYLAAYVRTFGPKFSAERLEFSEGFMHSDRANMKVLRHFECVTLTADGNFCLSEKGRALIAPFELVGDQEMEAAHAG
jgi:hypothetical protein